MQNKNETNEEDGNIIPPYLFEIPKRNLFLPLLLCEANKKTSEKHHFTISLMKNLNLLFKGKPKP